MELLRRTLIFFLVMSSSDTQNIKKNLTATEGGSIILPDPAGKQTFLLHVTNESKNIAMVTNEEFLILEESFRNRLLWNSSTGRFTITDLQKNDSGIYSIDSKRGNVFSTSYKLTVYASVLQPAVNTSAVSSDSCTLVCFVEEGDETKLWWLRGEESVNQSSSDLSLPLTVHKHDFNSSFTCVAANPAEEKTLLVDVKTSCSRQSILTDTTGSIGHRMNPILIPSIVLVLVLVCLIIGIYFMKMKPWRNKRLQGSVRSENLHYADIQITDKRVRQAENVQDSSEPVQSSNLISVYDKLQLHRMKLADPNVLMADMLYGNQL